MYKKIQRLWFKKPILFSIFVKKLNYVLIFKTNYKRNPTRNQGCCFHTFNVPEESNTLLLQANTSIYV
jgi:hypothetical protein